MQSFLAIFLTLAIATRSLTTALNEDKLGKFNVVLQSGEKIRRKCVWVQKKARSRCKLVGVKDHCPKTCYQYDPDNDYASEPDNWCKDTSSEFTINSIIWIRKKKTCAWAGKMKPTRCEIHEVKENCPVLCDFCNCQDNQNRFDVSLLNEKKRNCKWAKSRDTWWRCVKYPEIKENCPLSCGECDYSFPTTSPSAAPSERLHPVAVVETTSSIEIEAEIPTDQIQLIRFKEILIEAFTLYLPSGSKITDLYLSSSHQNDMQRTTETTNATFRTVKKIPCVPAICDEAVNEQKQAMITATVTASSPEESGLGKMAKEIAETKNLQIKIATTGMSTSISNTEIVQITRNPSSIPSKIPTILPSTKPSNSPSLSSSTPSEQSSTTPSSSPSQSPSLRPSQQQPTVTPSVQPITTPSSNPSVSPTLEPTSVPSIEPSAQPSSKPSVDPTTDPSSTPSLSPSQGPSSKLSENPSSVPTVSPSLTPSSSPSQSPSLRPSQQPSTKASSSPSYPPSTMPSNAFVNETSPEFAVFPSDYGDGKYYYADDDEFVCSCLVCDQSFTNFFDLQSKFGGVGTQPSTIFITKIEVSGDVNTLDNEYVTLIVSTFFICYKYHCSFFVSVHSS